MHNFINFKNFADARLSFSRPLTILIGKNGSGKTNIIEGIQVFAHLAQGIPLHEFSDVGKGGSYEVRGGLDNCIGFAAAEFELCFDRVSIPFVKGKFNADYKIKIGRKGQGESILSEERLFLTRPQEQKSNDYTFFDVRRSGDKLEVKYDNFTGDIIPVILTSAERSVMSRYEKLIAGKLAANNEGGVAPLVVDSMSHYLQTAYIFDTNPKVMRGYERIAGHTRLSREGGNLSAVLYGLKEGKELEKLKRITEIVRHLPEESFSKMDFIKTSANDVMLGFHVGNGKPNKRFFDARMLSDGTLRLLAVLTALETVPENSRVVIEEFDSGLHPSRVQRLIKYIYETAERRKLSILVTTHNPAVMNALTEEQMKSIVLCYRDKETGHSKLTPLMDIQDVDLMMLRGNLGDLVTDEIVEKYLSSEFRKERAEIARKWKERYFP